MESPSSSQHNKRQLSRASSPSLFIPLESPAASQNRDTRHQIKAAGPIVIDLTGDSDDDEPPPARPPRTPRTRKSSQDRITSRCEPQCSGSSLTKEKSEGLSPPKSSFVGTSEISESTSPKATSKLEREVPSMPDTRGRSKSTTTPQDSTRPAIYPYQTSDKQDSTKLQPFNREWVQRHRQRQRDKYRSPTRHVARRRFLPVWKFQRAKRPLTKPKTSSKGGKKSVVRVCDIYDDFESPERINGRIKQISLTSDGFAREGKKLEHLPRLESCKELTMEDIKDFDRKEIEFNDTFEQTFDQVLGDAKMDNTLVTSFVSTLSQNERPTFLKPLSGLVFITLGTNTFPVYQDYLSYYCPLLFQACGQATSTPDCLADVDPDVFGLFVQWLYAKSLLNKYGEPAYQHRLIGLWVLAKRLCMPQLQNDAIDMLERRRMLENCVQIKALDFVYRNTEVGDGLRKYLVGVCLPIMHMFSPETRKELFPKEFENNLTEAEFVKLEEKVRGEDEGSNGEQRDMSKYHVADVV